MENIHAKAFSTRANDRLALASATATAVLPTVALEPVDNNQVAPISAPVAGQVQTRILASVVGQDPQGQEVLSPVNAQTRLCIRQRREYRGYLTNNSPDRIRNMKVTMNIPANMELVSTSDVEPTRAFGSMDRCQFFQYMPLKPT